MTKRRPTVRDLLPLAPAGRRTTGEPTGDAFDPSWLDFDRGIRVGNLEPHERITQILKYRLERRYGTRFVTDRWGRGVYWQWICWVPLADRQAKPISHDVNFGCAKLFISIEREKRLFQCGMQVERGYVRGDRSVPWRLQSDWDWHRLMKGCVKGGPLEGELRRLLGEGFLAAVIGGDGGAAFGKGSFRSAAQIRAAARVRPADDWAGFQLYYPISEAEVRACSGRELVEAVLGAFSDVVPAMNLCMHIQLQPAERLPALGKA